MQPGFWHTKLSDINHLVLPDSLAISRSSYASEYPALRRMSGFQQMKLRKIIQARPIKSLATSKSSHASQYIALRRKSGFQQTKLCKIIQARPIKSLASSKSSEEIVTLSGSERSLLFSKIMTSSYHSLFVNSGIRRWRNTKQVCQQDVYCLLLNSTCALLFLRMSLQYISGVDVTATCERGTSRCTLCTAAHWHAMWLNIAEPCNCSSKPFGQ